MRSIKAIFIKQAKDMLKNPMVMVQFLIFPIVALIMTQLVAKPNPDIPNNMFITMMAAIFAGMALITSTAGVITEDMEHKSIRFLIMAGVKPHQYLLGTSGFIMIVGVMVSIVFGLIGTFTVVEFAKFMTVMILGVVASILLGAAIGMLSKNQQVANAVSMPIAIIFGFTPMIANFNVTIQTVASVLYTQQLNVIVNDFSANFMKAIVVIAINIFAFVLLFILAYRKNGLKG